MRSLFAHVACRSVNQPFDVRSYLINTTYSNSSLLRRFCAATSHRADVWPCGPAFNFVSHMRYELVVARFLLAVLFWFASCLLLFLACCSALDLALAVSLNFSLSCIAPACALAHHSTLAFSSLLALNVCFNALGLLVDSRSPPPAQPPITPAQPRTTPAHHTRSLVNALLSRWIACCAGFLCCLALSRACCSHSRSRNCAGVLGERRTKQVHFAVMRRYAAG